MILFPLLLSPSSLQPARTKPFGEPWRDRQLLSDKCAPDLCLRPAVHCPEPSMDDGATAPKAFSVLLPIASRKFHQGRTSPLAIPDWKCGNKELHPPRIRPPIANRECCLLGLHPPATGPAWSSSPLFARVPDVDRNHSGTACGGCKKCMVVRQPEVERQPNDVYDDCQVGSSFGVTIK